MSKGTNIKKYFVNRTVFIVGSGRSEKLNLDPVKTQKRFIMYQIIMKRMNRTNVSIGSDDGKISFLNEDLYLEKQWTAHKGGYHNAAGHLYS